MNVFKAESPNLTLYPTARAYRPSLPVSLTLHVKIMISKTFMLLGLLAGIFCSGGVSANTAIVDLRQFAEAYEPIPVEGSVIPNLPIPPKGIEAAIGFMKDNNYKHHEQYLVLVFLKLYRYHIENFHQSYDLRGSNRHLRNLFLVELCRLWNLKCENVEFLPSSIVYESIKGKNNYSYAKIDEEIIRIKAAIKAIRTN